MGAFVLLVDDAIPVGAGLPAMAISRTQKKPSDDHSSAVFFEVMLIAPSKYKSNTTFSFINLTELHASSFSLKIYSTNHV